MKSVICSIIIAVLLLGGCAKRETEVHTKKTEVPAVMQTTEEIEDVKEIEQSYVSDKNNEDEWIAYSTSSFLIYHFCKHCITYALNFSSSERAFLINSIFVLPGLL